MNVAGLSIPKRSQVRKAWTTDSLTSLTPSTDGVDAGDTSLNSRLTDAFLYLSGQVTSLDSHVLWSSAFRRLQNPLSILPETSGGPYGMMNSKRQILTTAGLLTPKATPPPPPPTAIFRQNFDRQSPGKLATGSTANTFTGTGGESSNLRVIQYYADRPRMRSA
jgi:hypothetical protein